MEIIRLIFFYGGVPFENEFLKTHEQFLELKKKLPFGQVPAITLPDGEGFLAETMPMMRYAADRAGILGSSAVVRAKADMIVSRVFPFRDCLAFQPFRPSPQEEVTRIFEVEAPKHLDVAEAYLTGTKVSEGHAVDAERTWCDLVIFEMMDWALELNKALPKSTPGWEKSTTMSAMRRVSRRT